MFFIKSKKERGFTLIESLIAISVLMVVITAMYLLINQSIEDTIFARDNTIASFLARDGMEYVKHIANSNRTNDDVEWLDGLELCSSEGGTKKCMIDTSELNYKNTGVIRSCVSGCDLLKYNETENIYGYGTGSDWEETKFEREIIVDERYDIDPEVTTSVTRRPDIIKITSIVRWDDGGNSQEIKIVDYLFDW